MSENGNIVHDSKQVADIISTYYINVAAHIGESSDDDNGYTDHPRIKSISEKLFPGSNIKFKNRTLKDVTKIRRSQNPQKNNRP